jgi:hypothetical protein
MNYKKKTFSKKNLTIVNITSVAFENSRITLINGTLTFTEGSLAKQYRDEALEAKNASFFESTSLILIKTKL